MKSEERGDHYIIVTSLSLGDMIIKSDRGFVARALQRCQIIRMQKRLK